MNAERDGTPAEQLSSLPAEAWDRLARAAGCLRGRAAAASRAAAGGRRRGSGAAGTGVATGRWLPAAAPNGVPLHRGPCGGPGAAGVRAAAGERRARVSADRATVRVTGLRPSRAGQFYELW